MRTHTSILSNFLFGFILLLALTPVVVSGLDRELLNLSPVANAGPDQTVEEELMVHLDGSDSSDQGEGDIESYIWTQCSGSSIQVEIYSFSTMSPDAWFTAPDVDEDVILTFQLTVTNVYDLADSDTCAVTITNAEENGGGDGDRVTIGCFISAITEDLNIKEQSGKSPLTFY
jgi:hypothetical protein